MSADPGHDAELADWDHVVEASLEVTSGRVLVMSPAGPASAPIAVPPGWWRVRAHRSVFSEEHEAARVVLWPAPDAPTRVLVRYEQDTPVPPSPQ